MNTIVIVSTSLHLTLPAKTLFLRYIKNNIMYNNYPGHPCVMDGRFRIFFFSIVITIMIPRIRINYYTVVGRLTSWGAFTTPVLYPCWNAEPKAEAMMANSSLPLRLCNKKQVGGCWTGSTTQTWWTEGEKTRIVEQEHSDRALRTTAVRALCIFFF